MHGVNKYGRIDSWNDLMRKLTLHPRAVCRSLLTTLDGYKDLSAQDEQRIIRAIESTGINTERVLAFLSRNTLKEIMKNI